MTEENPLIRQWQQKVKNTDQNNILMHCKDCGEEWVSSQQEGVCYNCGSQKLESIRCWQFPDG